MPEMPAKIYLLPTLVVPQTSSQYEKEKRRKSIAHTRAFSSTAHADERRLVLAEDHLRHQGSTAHPLPSSSISSLGSQLLPEANAKDVRWESSSRTSIQGRPRAGELIPNL